MKLLEVAENARSEAMGIVRRELEPRAVRSVDRVCFAMEDMAGRGMNVGIKDDNARP